MGAAPHCSVACAYERPDVPKPNLEFYPDSGEIYGGALNADDCKYLLRIRSLWLQRAQMLMITQAKADI
jgi:hypothetical protein